MSVGVAHVQQLWKIKFQMGKPKTKEHQINEGFGPGSISQ